MSPILLSELENGACAEVCSLHTQGALRRRLLDIGLAPGERVQMLFSACTGGMTAYLIAGAVIGLRKEDAATVTVRKI